ncbi:MAG TPA: DNA-directed RNA polymerase subunit omega [Syntrophomonadaceae bacterium]|nr:DNA-directed RNA polymerase subunit omega [Syntrophomonadaceae bacterium]
MIPPSTRELLNIGNSKYAVVVAVAKRARILSEQKKNDENFRVSSMVTEALDDIYRGRIEIQYK